MTSALYLTLFHISMNQTQTSPLPSKVLLTIMLKIMIKGFKLIPKLYHVSFSSRGAQCTCQSYLIWHNANFRPTAIQA